MDQTSGCQSTIETLYALYKKHGYIHGEKALNLMTDNGISLVGINKITDKLIDMGVIFSDGHNIILDLFDNQPKD